MSVFELFRGFFGIPEGHNRGCDRSRKHTVVQRASVCCSGTVSLHWDANLPQHDHEQLHEDMVFRLRESFFDVLTRELEDAFHQEYLERFDDVFRYSFSFERNRMNIQEPQLFDQMFQDTFSGFDHFSHASPSIEAPAEEKPEGHSRREGRSGNSLRDFMLTDPSPPDAPRAPRSPFHNWNPFSKYKGILSDGPRQKEEERKEDGDLDSQVSSGGLDQILTPTPSQPKTRSFFKSITVTKVVNPDGTVEERRTVRDGQGNEETTVTRSGGPVGPEGLPDEPASPTPGGSGPFSNMEDELFSRFFGGFRN